MGYWENNNYIHTKGEHWLGNYEQRKKSFSNAGITTGQLLKSAIVAQKAKEEALLKEFKGGFDEFEKLYLETLQFTGKNSKGQEITENIVANAKRIMFFEKSSLLTKGGTKKRGEETIEIPPGAFNPERMLSGQFIKTEAKSDFKKYQKQLKQQSRNIQDFLNAMPSNPSLISSSEIKAFTDAANNFLLRAQSVQSKNKMDLRTLKPLAKAIQKMTNLGLGGLGYAYEPVVLNCMLMIVKAISIPVSIQHTGNKQRTTNLDRELNSIKAKVDGLLKTLNLSFGFNIKSTSLETMSGKHGVHLQSGGTVEGFAGSMSDEIRDEFLWVLLNYIKLTMISQGRVKGQPRPLLSNSETTVREVYQKILEMLVLSAIGHSFLSDFYKKNNWKNQDIQTNEELINSDFLVLSNKIFRKSEILEEMAQGTKFEPILKFKDLSNLKGIGLDFDIEKNRLFREEKKNKKKKTNSKLMEDVYKSSPNMFLNLHEKIRKVKLDLSLKYNIKGGAK